VGFDTTSMPVVMSPSRFSAASRLATRQFGFAALAISLLILSPIAFHSKSPLVFYRFDGTFLLIEAAMKKVWSVSDWYFTTNPLQAIGGLELPQHCFIDPPLWLAAHLPASIGPTAAMTVYAVLLAATICWLATRLGMAPLPTIFAAWLGPLLALPYVYPSLGFDFLWGDPTYIMLIALNTAAILLFLDLGRGPWVADIGRFTPCTPGCAVTKRCGRWHEASLRTSSPNLALILLFNESWKGPRIASGCRMEDWREAEALRIGDARDWPMMDGQAH